MLWIYRWWKNYKYENKERFLLWENTQKKSIIKIEAKDYVEDYIYVATIMYIKYWLMRRPTKEKKE